MRYPTLTTPNPVTNSLPCYFSKLPIPFDSYFVIRQKGSDTDTFPGLFWFGSLTDDEGVIVRSLRNSECLDNDEDWWRMFYWYCERPGHDAWPPVLTNTFQMSVVSNRGDRFAAAADRDLHSLVISSSSRAGGSQFYSKTWGFLQSSSSSSDEFPTGRLQSIAASQAGLVVTCSENKTDLYLNFPSPEHQLWEMIPIEEFKKIVISKHKTRRESMLLW